MPPLDPLEIDCRSVKTLLDGGGPLLLLDCREQDEYDYVRIESSRLMPMSGLSERLGELDEHRDRPIVVYCHHGVRSLQVAAWLKSHGFADVRSMAGGIDRWSVEIDPGLPRY